MILNISSKHWGKDLGVGEVVGEIDWEEARLLFKVAP